MESHRIFIDTCGTHPAGKVHTDVLRKGGRGLHTPSLTDLEFLAHKLAKLIESCCIIYWQVVFQMRHIERLDLMDVASKYPGGTNALGIPGRTPVWSDDEATAMDTMNNRSCFCFSK